MNFEVLKNSRLLSGIIPVLIALMIGCSGNEKEDRLKSSLKKYDEHLQNMNADELAKIFDENGSLGQEGGSSIQGRESIRIYISSFGSDINMIENRSEGTAVEFAGDSAMQSGNYFQKLVIHSDTMEVQGEFKAVWVDDPGQGFLLRKMTTKPLSK